MLQGISWDSHPQTIVLLVPSLSLGHTVHLFSHDRSNGTSIKAPLQEFNEFTFSPLESEQRVLCTLCVSAGAHTSRRHHFRGLKWWSVPVSFFPLGCEAFSGRPWHLTDPVLDTVSGGGTINVFKWSLHIDKATLRKIYREEQQIGPGGVSVKRTHFLNWRS